MPLQPRQWIAPTTITLETCANFFRMRHYDREIPILEQRTWVGFDLLVGMFARQRKLATPLTLGAVASTSTAVASSSLAVVEIDFSLVFTIGDSSRRRPGEFINPLGVAVDRDRDRIIAVDSFNHRIQVFAALDGAFLFEFGDEGNEPGQFNCPLVSVSIIKAESSSPTPTTIDCKHSLPKAITSHRSSAASMVRDHWKLRPTSIEASSPSRKASRLM